MPTHNENKSLLTTAFVFFFVIIGTIVVSIVARGYQLNIGRGPILRATGLLSATSRPKGASVYINDRLITATDDTINLPPEDYLVKILKDGYLPWQKNIKIKKETVFQTDTELFRSVPELRPISLSGAINPASSPDNTKIVFAVASASASKDNGLYLAELSDALIPLTRTVPRLLIANLAGFDWSEAEFKFSPNSRQILATFKTNATNYLLTLDNPIDTKKLYDITARLSLIQLEWEQQEKEIIQSRFDRLPKDLKNIVSTQSASLISFNSNDNKVLYLAAKNSIIPDHLISPPPAQSNQPQNRIVSSGNYYVYDLIDDTNFLIGSQSSLPNLFWLPYSNNLVYVEDQSIKVSDYDGTNRQTIFKGQFNRRLVIPWADGTKLITVTSPYQNAPENLYSISLK